MSGSIRIKILDFLVQQTDWNQLHGYQHVTDCYNIFEENIA